MIGGWRRTRIFRQRVWKRLGRLVRSKRPITPAQRRQLILSRLLAAALAVLLCLLSLAIAATSGSARLYLRGRQVRAVQADASNPFDGRTLYLDEDSAAVKAAADEGAQSSEREAAERLAQVPSAIWLAPEEQPPTQVGPYVRGVMRRAAQSKTMPVFVVYGIPGRDCGGYSGSDIHADEYLAWTGEIADAMSDAASAEAMPAAVIVEPDALAMSTQCPALASRLPLLAAAVSGFAAIDAAVYIDAGHSGWVPAEEMAGLLEQVGVRKVRGFALNVSNYNTDADEHAYGEQLAALTAGHYVVDTSRNGNGHGSEGIGSWCNVTGARVGRQPQATSNGSQDASLWIKTPGESDGTCNGGPAAGVWWPEQARTLLGW